jgi:hypothetical protein
MFSQGQLTFEAFFVAYYCNDFFLPKRYKIHKEFYKGNYKILLGFLLFIGILFVIKVFFKRYQLLNILTFDLQTVLGCLIDRYNISL